MAFNNKRFFVGPFKYAEHREEFLTELFRRAPSLEFRNGWKPTNMYVAFGYASVEHCGILSGGGQDDGETIFTSSEFLGMLRFNEE